MHGEDEARRRGSGAGRVRGEGKGRRRGGGEGKGWRRGSGKGDMPLLFAVNREGNQAVVSYLIDKDADPNKPNSSRITPLHVAAAKGYYEIAECLLSKGANVDPLSKDGESPLFWAALEGKERIVTLLLKHHADCNKLSNKMISPLHASLLGSSLSCLEILIEAGADVNGAGCSSTPIALAAHEGLDSCVECLLKNGADPNVPDEDNYLPIQIAAANRFEKCVDILLPHSPLPQYQGLTISEIIDHERAERLRRWNEAIEKADDAYWMKDYTAALEFYKTAAQVGIPDPTWYAKTSLCYLCLHDLEKYLDQAIKFAEKMKEDVSDAKKIVMVFAKKWKETRAELLK